MGISFPSEKETNRLIARSLLCVSFALSPLSFLGCGSFSQSVLYRA